jgi:FlgD Ig-like domain
VEYQFYFLDFAESDNMVYMHVFFRNMSEYNKWNPDPDIRLKLSATPYGQVWKGVQQWYATANAFLIGDRDEAWAYYFPRQIIAVADDDGQESSFNGHPAAMAYYQRRNPHLRGEVMEMTNTAAHGWDTEFGLLEPEDILEYDRSMSEAYRYGLGKNAPSGPFYADQVNPYTGGPMYGWPGVLGPGDARYEEWVWGTRNAYNSYNFWSELHDVMPRDSFSLDAVIMFVQLAGAPYQFPASDDVANIGDPGVQQALAPVLHYADIADIVAGSGYELPEPEAPEPPALTLVPGNEEVVISWSDINIRTPDSYYAFLQENPILDPDGLYREYDFEGYRLYRSFDGPVDSLAELVLQCSISDDNLVYTYTDRREDDVPLFRMTNGETVWYALVPYDKNIDPATGVEFSLPLPGASKVYASAVPVAPDICDFNQDGKANIVDIISLLLFQRENPGNLNADFNQDGSSDIADAVYLLLAMRDGTCRNAVGTELAAISGLSRVEEFTSGDIAYLEKIMAQLSLTTEEEAAFRLALYGASGPAALPKAFSLSQNTPNPFNPATTVSYSVPEGSAVHVSLKVYNIRGRLVRTLVDEVREPGAYTVFWEGTDQTGQKISSGVYFYRMQAGNFEQTRKMVLLK